MSLCWPYDLPSWLFALIMILDLVGFGVRGLHLTRGWVRRLHGPGYSHNDIVGLFLTLLTVFYGITLGLVAVGTRSTFSAVPDILDNPFRGAVSVSSAPLELVYRQLVLAPHMAPPEPGR